MLHRHLSTGLRDLLKMPGDFDEIIANGYKVMTGVDTPPVRPGTKITLRVCDASDMLRDVWKVKDEISYLVFPGFLAFFSWKLIYWY